MWICQARTWVTVGVEIGVENLRHRLLCTLDCVQVRAYSKRLLGLQHLLSVISILPIPFSALLKHSI